tara:strand:+ start:306 stop:644 length:339 start_codon:yes stop_codon:yes gene_type:complete
MHGPPIALIIAKKDAGYADFSGPTMVEARRNLMIQPDLPDEPDKPDHKELTPDDHGELMEIVAELRKASKTHAGQADRIEALCERMMAGSNGPDDSPDKDGVGEAKVFEPAE